MGIFVGRRGGEEANQVEGTRQLHVACALFYYVSPVPY